MVSSAIPVQTAPVFSDVGNLSYAPAKSRGINVQDFDIFNWDGMSCGFGMFSYGEIAFTFKKTQ